MYKSVNFGVEVISVQVAVKWVRNIDSTFYVFIDEYDR